MERHFHEQLQKLNDTLLRMAVAVETSIAKSIDALVNRDDKLADEVIADLSTNIAEEVIFIYQARSIKHHADTKGFDDIRSRS